MTPRRPSLHDRRGFTLIEIILVVILMGIIAVFASLFIVTGISGFVTSVDHAELSYRGGLAMGRLVAELSGELEVVETLAPSGESAKTYLEYAFQKNSDERRHIALVGSGSRKKIVLVHASGKDADPPTALNPEVLADNVESFTLVFRKFQGSGNEVDWSLLSDGMEDLAKIIVTLTLFVNDKDSKTVTFTTTVTPVDSRDRLGARYNIRFQHVPLPS